jgi:hypothetical protein
MLMLAIANSLPGIQQTTVIYSSSGLSLSIQHYQSCLLDRGVVSELVLVLLDSDVSSWFVHDY